MAADSSNSHQKSERSHSIRGAMGSRESATSRYLPSVLLQGLLFMAMTFPDAEWAVSSWTVGLTVLLLGWVGYSLVGNIVRLFRAPPAEATTWTAIRLAACGVLFVLVALGPLLEARLLGDRLLGFTWATLGAILLFLAARDVARRRNRPTVSTSHNSH